MKGRIPDALFIFRRLLSLWPVRRWRAARGGPWMPAHAPLPLRQERAEQNHAK